MTNPTLSEDDKSRFRVAILTLLVGIVLFCVKIYSYKITGSHAILSDALESIVNIIAALVSLTVIWVASKPADKDHPYGHGKVEYFSSAFEGGAIFFAGGLIVFEAIKAFFEGPQIKELDVGLLLVTVAGLGNGALGLYLQRRGKSLHSLALVSGGKHLLSDFWTSAGVIFGLLLVKFTGIVILDPVIALIVGIQLGFTGMNLLIKSGAELMDAEDSEVIGALGKLFEKHAFGGIIRMHYTRVIRSGRFHHVDSHIVVPEFWDISTAHMRTEEFEQRVMQDYALKGELHLHLDPCRRAYCQVCDLENCPIRVRPFRERIPFTLEELTSPTEPESYN